MQGKIGNIVQQGNALRMRYCSKTGPHKMKWDVSKTAWYALPEGVRCRRCTSWQSLPKFHEIFAVGTWDPSLDLNEFHDFLMFPWCFCELSKATKKHRIKHNRNKRLQFVADGHKGWSALWVCWLHCSINWDRQDVGGAPFETCWQLVGLALHVPRAWFVR